ncbi:hypothetical protein NPIL_676541 [Nephila pilipes]|uniref:Uncharacterized protein n=1 Tax=Nephila pilipes TaxID=299642 RepID=A0A8X6T5W1_NEPPI|nr:hypothetical protein NPIL_676541 [Nephila pilipes]
MMLEPSLKDYASLSFNNFVTRALMSLKPHRVDYQNTVSKTKSRNKQEAMESFILKTSDERRLLPDGEYCGGCFSDSHLWCQWSMIELPHKNFPFLCSERVDLYIDIRKKERRAEIRAD